MIKFFKILALFIISFFMCYWTKEEKIDILLDKVFFNTLSILIGLSIAIVGIFLGSINSLYLSLYKMIKKDGSQFSDIEIDTIKDGLSDMIKELRDDTFLSVYSLITIIVLFVIKSIDFPYIHWFIESTVITKNFSVNVFIIFISTLIFWSIVDSVKVVFKITNAFELVKDKNPG
jgi:hypothetical protein